MGKISLEELEKKLKKIDPEYANYTPNRFEDKLLEGERAVDFLIEKLSSEDPDERADAAEILGKIGSKKAVLYLKRYLNDPSAKVKLSVSLALIQLGEKKLLDEIIKNLKSDDKEVVIGSILALGNARYKEAVPYLLDIFRTNDPTIGSAIAWALGEIGSPEAIEMLETAVENYFVAPNACEALGKIGSIDSIECLLSACDSPNDDTKAYSARAISMIINKNKNNKRLFIKYLPKINKKLKNLLNHKNPKVRIFSALALYQIGNEKMADFIVEELEKI